MSFRKEYLRKIKTNKKLFLKQSPEENKTFKALQIFLRVASEWHEVYLAPTMTTVFADAVAMTQKKSDDGAADLAMTTTLRDAENKEKKEDPMNDANVNDCCCCCRSAAAAVVGAAVVVAVAGEG